MKDFDRDVPADVPVGCAEGCYADAGDTRGMAVRTQDANPEPRMAAPTIPCPHRTEMGNVRKDSKRGRPF